MTEKYLTNEKTQELQKIKMAKYRNLRWKSKQAKENKTEHNSQYAQKQQRQNETQPRQNEIRPRQNETRPRQIETRPRQTEETKEPDGSRTLPKVRILTRKHNQHPASTPGSTDNTTQKPRSYAEILKPTRRTPQITIQDDVTPTSYQEPPKNEKSPQPHGVEGGIQELLQSTMLAFDALKDNFIRLADIKKTHLEKQ